MRDTFARLVFGQSIIFFRHGHRIHLDAVPRFITTGAFFEADKRFSSSLLRTGDTMRVVSWASASIGFVTGLFFDARSVHIVLNGSARTRRTVRQA